MDKVHGKIGLWDSQWVNIMNHDHCYEGYKTEDAVNAAVKITEAVMVENINEELCRLTEALEKADERANDFMWQVRNTCARAEKAEAERDALRARIEGAAHGHVFEGCNQHEHVEVDVDGGAGWLEGRDVALVVLDDEVE